MTEVNKKVRLPTGFMMTSYEIGLEKFHAFLGRFYGFLDTFIGRRYIFC